MSGEKCFYTINIPTFFFLRMVGRRRLESIHRRRNKGENPEEIHPHPSSRVKKEKKKKQQRRKKNSMKGGAQVCSFFPISPFLLISLSCLPPHLFLLSKWIVWVTYTQGSIFQLFSFLSLSFNAHKNTHAIGRKGTINNKNEVKFEKKNCSNTTCY